MPGPLSAALGPVFCRRSTQAVSLRAKAIPVLYISDPPVWTAKTRRDMLDALADLTPPTQANWRSRINTRIAQYEMAFRMQLPF